MLKTAEFAKMCHTTKDTLIFYDRIDVFKPAFVDSKKYRYYEVRQAVQFAFLSHLRDIGFSLEEIKEFIKRPNEEKFIKRLEERSEAFREEIEKAKRFLRYTDGILELSKEASRHVEGVISVERKKERTFQYTPFLKSCSFNTMREYTDFLFESRQDETTSVPWGYVADFKRNADNRLVFLGSLDFPLKRKGVQLLKLPAGHYASWFFRGDMNEHQKLFRKKVSELEKNYVLTDKAFLFDQSSVLLLGNGEVFTTKYEILLIED